MDVQTRNLSFSHPPFHFLQGLSICWCLLFEYQSRHVFHVFLLRHGIHWWIADHDTFQDKFHFIILHTFTWSSFSFYHTKTCHKMRQKHFTKTFNHSSQDTLLSLSLFSHEIDYSFHLISWYSFLSRFFLSGPTSSTHVMAYNVLFMEKLEDWKPFPSSSIYFLWDHYLWLIYLFFFLSLSITFSWWDYCRFHQLMQQSLTMMLEYKKWCRVAVYFLTE